MELNQFLKMKDCPWELRWGLPSFAIGIGIWGKITGDTLRKHDAEVLLSLWLGFWLIFGAVKAAIIEANRNTRQ